MNLGKSVAEALLERSPSQIGEIEPFNGAGIYAIYYRGDFEAYGLLAECNASNAHWPIYVGKAIPSGGRKGSELFSGVVGTHLFGRLRQHADSIDAAENLRVSDFTCRYLVVDDIWIPLAETLLISAFRPAWNLIIEGFGNHDPGRGRYQGLRPLWDVLHPGRGWASRCQERPETAKELAKRARRFLSENRPPDDPRDLFRPTEIDPEALGL